MEENDNDNDHHWWTARVRALAASAATTTADDRQAEWQSLERVDAASSATALTGRRAAAEAARRRRCWLMSLAASQGDLCGAVLLNPCARSRADVEAELVSLLRCKSGARAAVTQALHLVSLSLAWRRLLVVRPGVEDELRDGKFGLGDLRDVVRCSVSLRLRIEKQTGALTPPEQRLSRDASFDWIGCVDLAKRKGSERRLKRQRLLLERMEVEGEAGEGSRSLTQGGGGGSSSAAAGSDDGGGDGGDDDDDASRGTVREQVVVVEEAHPSPAPPPASRELVLPPLAALMPAPAPAPAPSPPPPPHHQLPDLSSLGDADDSGILDEIVELAEDDDWLPAAALGGASGPVLPHVGSGPSLPPMPPPPLPPPPIVVRRSSSSGSGSGEGNNGSDDAPPSRRGLRRRRSLASDAADQGEVEAEEEEYEEPAPRRPRLPPPPPPPPLPPLTTAHAADLLALERLAAPLVLGACGEREIGVSVAPQQRLHVPSSDAVARCFCLMARMLRKAGGGDACEEANWRACTDPAVLALGMGPAFTTAERRVVVGGCREEGEGDDAAPNTSQLVVWLDPDVCAAATDSADPGRARDLRCAAVAPGGPFWLCRGGGGGGERVRHGTMLVVPAAGGDGGRRVELSGSSMRRGQQPLGLVELRFYASESVLEACARLGGGAASVRAAMVVA